MDSLFFLFLGHFAGDYSFQSDALAKSKSSSLIALFIHSCIYSICIIGAILFHDIFYYPNLLFASVKLIPVVLALHFIQDLVKSRFFNGSKQFYYIDQFIHITVLFAFRIIIGA